MKNKTMSFSEVMRRKAIHSEYQMKEFISLVKWMEGNYYRTWLASQLNPPVFCTQSANAIIYKGVQFQRSRQLFHVIIYKRLQFQRFPRQLFNVITYKGLQFNLDNCSISVATNHYTIYIRCCFKKIKFYFAIAFL